MVGVGLALCKLGREGGVLVDWSTIKFAKWKHRARSTLLYCSGVAWIAQLISCVSLADTCRGNDTEHYGHNAGIAVSLPLSRWT